MNDHSVSQKKRYLRTPEIAEYCGLSESFFNNARVRGGGPPFIHVGRAVLYDLADVDRWLDAGRRQSTSEAA
ncbi:helix-turn-helix transcriptional regulator [Shumkonia mesophila]|uniref:helix-turn-helix transcriptional regulator n=1 Tax=Shumkonia mesophila TaxID=2838854 RepID=UPI002934C1DF|nr:helix-turn-helix domain-containing protein [Shumkonia mesophila]